MDIHIALLQVGLVVSASLMSVAIDVPRSTLDPPKVECRLHVEQGSSSDPLLISGKFTLKNHSAQPLKIKYYTHPTMHLDLDVKDEKGKTLPKNMRVYGLIFSGDGLHPEVLTIKPGATYRTNVVFLVQVDEEKHPIAPGKYTVEATYKWTTPIGAAASVKSDKVTIEVTAK